MLPQLPCAGDISEVKYFSRLTVLCRNLYGLHKPRPFVRDFHNETKSIPTKSRGTIPLKVSAEIQLS